MNQSSSKTMSRRIVTMFQTRFGVRVELGLKKQTIRLKRKVPVRVGDTIDCREWMGRPRRSKQRKLWIATVTSVRSITINTVGGYVTMRSGEKVKIRRENFARADGFLDWYDMREWFLERYGLPFSGVLISW